MGYYATLMDYKINNARINPAKKDKFLKEIKKECYFGFEPDNFKIEIDDKGNIKDFEVEEWHTKWYDEEEFEYILSEYLEEGSVYFEFRGEDGYDWSSIVFPKLTLDGNWIEYSADRIIGVFDDEEIPQQVKEKILSQYKEYWENKLKEAQNNLNILKKETGKNRIEITDEIKNKIIKEIKSILEYSGFKTEFDEVSLKEDEIRLYFNKYYFKIWEDKEKIKIWIFDRITDKETDIEDVNIRAKLDCLERYLNKEIQ